MQILGITGRSGLLNSGGKMRNHELYYLSMDRTTLPESVRLNNFLSRRLQTKIVMRILKNGSSQIQQMPSKCIADLGACYFGGSIH
jgi:hypothetical protein